MTFTWSDTSLTTALSQVRQTIGDTKSDDVLLTDEQINFRLGQYAQDVMSASVRCVQDIIAKLARDYDRSNQGFSATRSQKIQHYKDLLVELKDQGITVCEISVGGLSRQTVDDYASDDDYPLPAFSVGQDDKGVIG